MQAFEGFGEAVAPPPKRIKSLQALMRLRPPNNCQWGVIAFVLNQDMIQPEGTLDDFHGLVFNLGSFSNVDDASKHAKTVMEMTGHPAVIPVQYGFPFRLTNKFDPKHVEQVYVDRNNKIIDQMEDAMYRESRETYEKRMDLEREIVQEAEEEMDPESLEYFKRQCYLAIKNRATYHMHTKEAESTWENYKKRESSIREHYAKHPKHEEEWLPMLKKKLAERGEISLYGAIESAYKELREELLGLNIAPTLECGGSPQNRILDNLKATPPQNDNLKCTPVTVAEGKEKIYEDYSKSTVIPDYAPSVCDFITVKEDTVQTIYNESCYQSLPAIDELVITDGVVCDENICINPVFTNKNGKKKKIKK